MFTRTIPTTRTWPPRRPRECIWSQLIKEPNRSAADIILIAAEEGIDIDHDYVWNTRARWRNSLAVLKEAGYDVPG